MKKILKLQKMPSAATRSSIDAISWSSCDSGSCNGQVIQ
ncbi:class III lanthipeptide [Natronoglycomyces albus]|uniref:Class III lanthipeptide n=1 Tax=Natronoglycomyces albus TaxID=2811108 RepID=A0A895XNX9_9ACTN|nr:class III lanthipeptide [Natronoglycomyces albus]QSB04206.1 class III lanthipeptide [Natronoglycomyces albus]